MPFRITTAVFLLAVILILTTNPLNDNFWLILISTLAIYLIILGLGSFVIQFSFFNRNYNSTLSPGRKIAITFDDGPLQSTSHILDFLDRKNAKATFFCIGKNIVENPGVFKEIASRHHAIGHHSFSHSNFFPFFSAKRIMIEIEKTNQVIYEICGIKTTLFRPPFGVTNPNISKAAKRLKMKVIGWNLRSLDGTNRNKKKILKKVIPNIKPGSLILLHDTHPDIMEILGAIFEEVEKQKLIPVTVNEFFEFE